MFNLLHEKVKLQPIDNLPPNYKEIYIVKYNKKYFELDVLGEYFKHILDAIEIAEYLSKIFVFTDKEFEALGKMKNRKVVRSFFHTFKDRFEKVKYKK